MEPDNNVPEVTDRGRRRFLGRAAMTMGAAQFGMLGRLAAEGASASLAVPLTVWTSTRAAAERLSNSGCIS